jgi:hypothetical protein
MLAEASAADVVDDERGTGAKTLLGVAVLRADLHLRSSIQCKTFYAISSRDRSRSWPLSCAGGLPGLTARRVRIPQARAASSSRGVSDTNTTASVAILRLSAMRV